MLEICSLILRGGANKKCVSVCVRVGEGVENLGIYEAEKQKLMVAEGEWCVLWDSSNYSLSKF